MKKQYLHLAMVLFLTLIFSACSIKTDTPNDIENNSVETAQPSDEPTQAPIVKLDKTFTTTFGEVNAITYPSFAFDYSDNWEISENNVNADRETITLKNARGITITYTHLSGSNFGGGSGVSMSRVEVSKVADSNLVPGYVQSTDYSNLGEFMVAKLKVTGTLNMQTDTDFTDVDGITAYAVIPISRIGMDSTVRHPFIVEYGFDYSSIISLLSQFPDGEYTKEEEQEVIAILQSFRVNP